MSNQRILKDLLDKHMNKYTNGQFQNLILINKKNKQGITDSGAMNILLLEDFFSHSV